MQGYGSPGGTELPLAGQRDIDCQSRPRPPPSELPFGWLIRIPHWIILGRIPKRRQLTTSGQRNCFARQAATNGTSSKWTKMSIRGNAASLIAQRRCHGSLSCGTVAASCLLKRSHRHPDVPNENDRSHDKDRTDERRGNAEGGTQDPSCRSTNRPLAERGTNPESANRTNGQQYPQSEFKQNAMALDHKLAQHFMRLPYLNRTPNLYMPRKQGNPLLSD